MKSLYKTKFDTSISTKICSPKYVVVKNKVVSQSKIRKTVMEQKFKH